MYTKIKSSSLPPHQAKELANTIHSIHNLHVQNLKHYILGKNPTSFQNAIRLAKKKKKKNAELPIIEG